MRNSDFFLWEIQVLIGHCRHFRYTVSPLSCLFLPPPPPPQFVIRLPRGPLLDFYSKRSWGASTCGTPPHRCECEPWRPHLVHPPINLSLSLLLLLLLLLFLLFCLLCNITPAFLISHPSAPLEKLPFFPPLGPPLNKTLIPCFSHCSTFSHLVSPARNRPVLQRLIRTGIDNQPTTVLHFSVIFFGTLRKQYFLTADFYLEVFNVWPYHFEPAFIHMLRYVFTVSSFRILSSDKLTTVIFFFSIWNMH